MTQCLEDLSASPRRKLIILSTVTIDWILVYLGYIWDRIRYSPKKARKLLRLRRQFIGDRDGLDQDRLEKVKLAKVICELKQQVIDAIGQAKACGSCAKNRPLPYGHWTGGFCCGGHTRLLFTDKEIFLLRLSGTRPMDLKLSSAELAGCLFRGPEGCSLKVTHRPAICVRYICDDLARDLHFRGQWLIVDNYCDRIYKKFKEVL